jgi:gas vesicle protein
MRFGKQEEPEQSSTAGTAITFLLIGMGVGALVTLLYAPKTGRQLRRDLLRRYEDAREAVEDWKEEARETAEEVIERGADIAEEIRDRVTPLAKNIRRGRG